MHSSEALGRKVPLLFTEHWNASLLFPVTDDLVSAICRCVAHEFMHLRPNLQVFKLRAFLLKFRVWFRVAYFFSGEILINDGSTVFKTLWNSTAVTASLSSVAFIKYMLQLCFLGSYLKLSVWIICAMSWQYHRNIITSRSGDEIGLNELVTKNPQRKSCFAGALSAVVKGRLHNNTSDIPSHPLDFTGKQAGTQEEACVQFLTAHSHTCFTTF